MATHLTGTSQMQAIIFDVFGTLITYGGKRINPYRHLSLRGARLPFLTRDVGVDVFAQELGLGQLIPLIRSELSEEIAALQLFDDVGSTLSRLRAEGRHVAVCSNMAAEYGPAVRSLLPQVDAYVFSYEVGAKKPSREIYAAACSSLGCAPGNVLFIGDSLRADVEGPRAFGMQARLIDRGTGQMLEEVLAGG